MIDEADMIIGMEQGHIHAVMDLAPYAGDKTFLLTSFDKNNEAVEIDDPLGGFSKDYFKTFEIIKKAVEALADKLGERSLGA